MNKQILFTTMVLSFVVSCGPKQFAFEQVGLNEKKTSDVPVEPEDPIDPPEVPCGNAENPCPLDPLVESPGVVTILLALGDQVGDQLIVNGVSSQYLAETAVRYASPVSNPKILVVKDLNHNGESAYDTEYIASVLLSRYETDFIMEPEGGMTAETVAGYDLIWFNNPGHPMGSIQSRNVLMAFSGGVILSGDDMARGNGFDMSPLTGLTYVDNGTSVMCDGVSYPHDNNGGYQFHVTLDSDKFPGLAGSDLSLNYGNDIDNTISSSDVEVLAWAVGGASSCTEPRATVVRYKKNSPITSISGSFAATLIHFKKQLNFSITMNEE